jgi:heterodisulfide reductase subunit C
MLRTAGEIASSFSLSSCVRCGLCDDVCPSGRNGGIHPDAVIYAIIDADPSSDMRMQADVWKCLMCHRCSMNCPNGIDVAGAVRALRYTEVSSGDFPKRFMRSSGSLAEEGRAFPVNEAVNKKRSELGLEAIDRDAASVGELKVIISRTGFRYE